MNAKIIFRRKFPSKCNKPIVKWYKPHGAIQQYYMHYGLRHKTPALIAPHAVAAKLDFVLYCVKVYPNAPNT